MNIRSIAENDIEKITEIYNWYILNTPITFEVEAIHALEMKQRVQEKLQKYDWLVAEVNQEIVGYAYYGAFHPRSAYSHTVESTIYLKQDQIRKGFGQLLYRELIRSATEKGFRELIALIALPNQGSITLHQKLGFSESGVLKKVGFKFEQYIDVGIWQKSLL
ncbi:GNAT family N-acetyltransferase [Egbenema bharatensis]|uniref:GNAT family N-acetyltransferase n=1 Tax=Egbenema bharatensis TaxID=3463334 RepID=UPI003A83D4ED